MQWVEKFVFHLKKETSNTNSKVMANFSIVREMHRCESVSPARGFLFKLMCCRVMLCCSRTGTRALSAGGIISPLPLPPQQVRSIQRAQTASVAVFNRYSEPIAILLLGLQDVHALNGLHDQVPRRRLSNIHNQW